MSCRTAICKLANTNILLREMQAPMSQKILVPARLASDTGIDVKMEPVSKQSSIYLCTPGWLPASLCSVTLYISHFPHSERKGRDFLPSGKSIHHPPTSLQGF